MQLGWGGGCFDEKKTKSLKDYFPHRKRMTNLIKVKGITYDTTYLVGNLQGYEGIVSARRGKLTIEIHSTIHTGLVQDIKRGLGEELDNFLVWVRNEQEQEDVSPWEVNNEDFHNMVWLH